MNKVSAVLNILRNMRPFADIDESTELIESELVDSLGLFELIGALEDEFDIRIDEDLIDPENFSTAKIIAERLLGGAE